MKKAIYLLSLIALVASSAFAERRDLWEQGASPIGVESKRAVEAGA
jgi:hypothetical protein